MAVENTMRQLNLLLVLMNSQRPITRAAIFERVKGYEPFDTEEALKAATKKFERDKADLRQYLVFNEVATGGDNASTYSIDREKSFFPDIDLTEDELILVSLATSGWRDAHLGQAAAAGAIIAGPEFNGGSNIFTAIGRDERHLRPLEQAISAKRIINFEYFSRSSNETKVRKVEPWRLVLHQEHWYLFGFDYERETELLFRLTRINGEIEITKDEILNPNPQDMNPLEMIRSFQQTEDEPQFAKIRVPLADCANLRLLAESFEETSNGDVLTIKYEDAYSLSREIALVCDRVEVLEPDSLKQRVTDLVNQVLARHK